MTDLADWSPSGAPDPRNAQRDEAILTAMQVCARTSGYMNVTRGQVAAEANLSAASVSNFGRTRITNGEHPRGDAIMLRLRDALMERAVADGDVELIAQGLLGRHPVALAAPDQMRAAAMAHAAGVAA